VVFQPLPGGRQAVAADAHVACRFLGRGGGGSKGVLADIFENGFMG
jgi:hypothetical protein